MEYLLYILGGMFVAGMSASSVRAIAHKSPFMAAFLLFVNSIIGLLVVVTIIQNVSEDGLTGVFVYSSGVFLGSYLVLKYTK